MYFQIKIHLHSPFQISCKIQKPNNQINDFFHTTYLINPRVNFNSFTGNVVLLLPLSLHSPIPYLPIKLAVELKIGLKIVNCI